MDTRTPSELLTEIKATTKLGEIALSKLLGISQPTVNRILNGKNCSSTALLAIQRVHSEMDKYVPAEAEQAAA
jgi:DNA-binding transcriptional regulator YdaS (Cro superfamily)